MCASRNRFVRFVALAAVLAAAVYLASPAGAQAPEPDAAGTAKPDDNLTVYRLVVSPAAEPRPALQYRFLVPPVDQIHANAATFYYKAMVIDGPDWIGAWNGDEQAQSWLEMPIDKLPLAEMKKKLTAIDGDLLLPALRGAAKADYCNWEDPMREFGMFTLLPQTQKMRSLARALSLLARLQIAEQQYAEAIDTLRLLYALSRNLGHAPSIVQSLVGMAIEEGTNDQTRALIAAPNAPNLYWALTELAGQPVELRQGFSFETHFWDFTYHKLRDLDQRTLTPQEVLGLLREIYEERGIYAGRKWGPEVELAALSTALAVEPAARAYLVEHGTAVADVDAMPILQRFLLYRWRQYAEVRDNYFKWTLLPDDESNQRAAGFEAQEQLMEKSDAGTPFSEFMSAGATIYKTRTRHERDLDLLRAVEALRMHAAQHGAWPQSLADVTAVPVPPDPMTNKPFEYSVAAGVATLSAPSPKPANASFPTVRYELHLLRKTNPAK